MPRKKGGMPFEVHPTPAKGKDGRNIVYVRPAMRDKLLMKGVDEFCSRNYGLRFGELDPRLRLFQMAAAELMAMGYRIDTPIGSFAPRLKLTREITDPDDVRRVRSASTEWNIIPANCGTSRSRSGRSNFCTKCLMEVLWGSYFDRLHHTSLVQFFRRKASPR